jgi:hypothetical protein
LVVASCRATHLFLCVYSLGLREVFIYYEFGAKWKIGKTSTPPFSAGLSAQGEALAFFWALAAQATCPPPSFSPPLSSWAGQATHGPAAVLPPPTSCFSLPLRVLGRSRGDPTRCGPAASAWAQRARPAGAGGSFGIRHRYMWGPPECPEVVPCSSPPPRRAFLFSLAQYAHPTPLSLLPSPSRGRTAAPAPVQAVVAPLR